MHALNITKSVKRRRFPRLLMHIIRSIESVKHFHFPG